MFNDEGADSRIDELTTTSLHAQTQAAGDFDIEWGQTTSGHHFWYDKMEKFRSWLITNGFDPEDKSLTLGHPQIGQVNLQKSFNSENFEDIWKILTSYSDVWKIKTSYTENTFDYHWSDDNYMQAQIDLMNRQ